MASESSVRTARMTTTSSMSKMKTVATGVSSPKAAATEEEGDGPTVARSHMSAQMRFLIALLVLITQGMTLVSAQKILAKPSVVAHLFGQIIVAFTSFFTHEWIRIHSFALTRIRRAFFDEVNILETYQPRSRTHGHLFAPDPPTPGPVVKIAEDPNQQQHTPAEHAAFNTARDSHYANMFQHAMRVAKESEEAERNAAADGSNKDVATAQSNTSEAKTAVGPETEVSTATSNTFPTDSSSATTDPSTARPPGDPAEGTATPANSKSDPQANLKATGQKRRRRPKN